MRRILFDQNFISYLNSTLRQIDLLSQFLSGIHIRILANCERLFKYVQLIRGKGGSITTVFLSWIIVVAVAGEQVMIGTG